MSNQYTGLEIAVVGMAGRFPQAHNISDFWNNLKNGIESIVSLEEAAILAEGESRDLVENPAYVKANAFIDGKEYFDADFFGYRPAEAKLMDPQLRIFHELCWTALEDAGYGSREQENKIGVFAGAMTNLNWENYAVLANRENIVDDYTASQLRNVSFLASRISYLLNLQGPTMYLNTACSTSLVAIQRACMSLLLRECDMALAGGVTINNYTHKGYLYEEGMINSPDGHCRTFDAQANGTVGGEGAGVVVLKRMEEALKDRDHIYAIVRGTAINNDGNDKTSFTAPSVLGQYKTILKAVNMAGIPTESISYVEAHGTATNLGDPIEVEALNLAFGKSEIPYCALGSVKSNIGHLDIAAGVAGFIKTSLALLHRQIPASLNFENPNPKINFRNSPFYVNTQLQQWKNDKFPLRAGVSSFGIGGTNAHAILEEAPRMETTTGSRDYQLFLFSAKTKEALARNVENFKSFLEGQKEINLADAAYTLQVGRNTFAYRKAIVCKNRDEAIESLAAEKENTQVATAFEKGNNSVVFMFSGQGSQYVNMCRDLYQREQIFRREIDQCLDMVEKQSGIKLAPILFSDSSLNGKALINQTQYTQPLLFMVEYALAKLLMHWGIQPEVMIGHSIGEYVAACISGVFTLEDALALVVKRGELMQKVAPGLMLSISIEESPLKAILKDHSGVSLAAVNSSELCVVSGEEAAIESFRAAIEKAGYQSKIITTSHAFHSQMMDEILEEFKAMVKTVKIQKQTIPYVSNVTGEYAQDEVISQPEYWANHLRQTVLFSQGLEHLLGEKNRLFIEVGPGKTLSTFVRSNHLRDKNKHRIVNLIRHPKEEVNDVKRILTGLGEIWNHGFIPSWSAFYEGEQRGRISLPTYSFEKQEFPVLVDSYRMISKLIEEPTVEKNPDVSQWLYVPSWQLTTPLITKPVLAKSTTLIFSDDSEVSDTLVEKFGIDGEAIIEVKIGKEFKKITSTKYRINPLEEEGYQSLFSYLAQDGLMPDRIIHAWAIVSEKPADFSEQGYEIYCYSLFKIIRQFQEHWDFSNKQLVVLTNEVHQVTNNASRPLAAISQGLLKVIAQEYSNICIGHIDVSLQEKNNALFFESLYREVGYPQQGKVISLRQGCRWEQTYISVKPPQEDVTPKLRRKGIYLITGGLGEMGFHLSRYLQAQWEATVILIGRNTSLSEEKEQRLETLKKEKGQVVYLSCEISDKVAFAKVFAAVEKEYGNVNGVIHAAGFNKGETIKLTSKLGREDFAKQNTAKVKGLIVLKEVLEDKPLDFCLLTSSLSAVVGGIMFSAYASANTFMDYYLKSYRATGALNNWISVNFDGIEFNDQFSREITSVEFIKLFELLLNHYTDLPQIVVSTTDLNKLLDHFVYQTEPLNDSAAWPLEDTFQNTPNHFDAPSGNASFNELEGSLLKIWSEFFGKSELALDDDFFDIGGDSLKALTIIGRINKELKTNLSVTDFFRWPTIQKLAEGILKRHNNSSLVNQESTAENQEEFIF